MLYCYILCRENVICYIVIYCVVRMLYVILLYTVS